MSDHGHSHGSGSSHGHSHGAAAAPKKSNKKSKKANKSNGVNHSGHSGHNHGHGGGDDHGHSHGGAHDGDHAHGPEHEREDEYKLDMEHEGLIAGECGGLHRGNEEGASQKTARARRGLMLVSVLCVFAIVVEVIGGLYAHSLAILTDAAHLLSDLAGFLISLFALWFTTKAPTSSLSFGFHRAEILGALLSVLLIWVVTGILVWEAVERIKNPEDVDGKFMFYLATGGLAINITMALILNNAGHAHSHGGGGDHGHSHGGGSEENVNVRSAYIHVIGDACQSVGVMIAAALIWYEPSWRIADPICTFVFSIIVLYTTVQLVRESVGVLMEGTPTGINIGDVEASLHSVGHVVAVHDLHIWSLSLGKPSLSVHLLVDLDGNRRAALVAASKMLARQYGIHHSTIQVEERDDNIHCNPSSAVATGNHTPTGPAAAGHGIVIGGGSINSPFAPLPAAAAAASSDVAAKKEYGTF